MFAMDKKPKIDLAGWLKPRRKMEITESDGVMVVVITAPSAQREPLPAGDGSAARPKQCRDAAPRSAPCPQWPAQSQGTAQPGLDACHSPTDRRPQE
jgi:hypothetical protein